MQFNAKIKTAICKNCGKEFPQTRKQIYCSNECYWQYRNNNPDAYLREQRVTLICDNCGKEFQRRIHEVRSAKVYCSKKCAGTITGYHPKRDRKDWHPSITKKCEYCGKEFITKGRRYNQRFCSRDCFNKHRSEHGWGDNNPNYRHGQNAVVARDTATRHFPMKCIICGFDAIVTIHHIIPKAEGGDNTPSNLAVLCPNHHWLADRNLIPKEELQLIVNDLLNK